MNFTAEQTVALENSRAANTVNLNKHLISGNMLKPYNMASYDGLVSATGTYSNNQIYRYNAELLPQILPPDAESGLFT